jgi:hypothetical protein
VHGLNMPRGGSLEIIGGHHGMRELASLVRRNVRARGARDGEDDRGKDGAHSNPCLEGDFFQLSNAPAAAHAFIWETACAF